MHECNKGKSYGVPKSFDSTYAMQYQFKYLISEDKLSFARDLFSLTVVPDAMKAELIKQISAYSWVFEPNGTVKLSGKTGNKNDDLIICAMMIPYWVQVFLNSSSYSNIRKKIKNYWALSNK